MSEQATRAQIREHYTSRGYQVRIDDEDIVAYRLTQYDDWKGGREVKQYLVNHDGTVFVR